MAISESIRHELSAVFSARVEAECFFQSLELAQDEEKNGNANPMIYAFRCQVERWAAACAALETAVRQLALPLVEDFEGAAR